MSLDDYLALLNWTGRQVRLDERGAIPVERPLYHKAQSSLRAAKV